MAIARRLYLYGIAAIALAVWAVGAVRLLRELGMALWELLGRPAVIGDPEAFRARLSLSVALLLVGFPIWAVHWWLVERAVRMDAAEQRSAVRAAFLAAVLAATFGFWLASVVELVRLALLWLFGVSEPGVMSVPRVLDELAVLAVAGTLWLGHARLARKEQRDPQRRELADWLPRLYGYGAAATGLVVLVVAIANLLRIGLDAVLLPDAVTGTLRFALASAIGLLVGGILAWSVHWAEALSLVSASSPVAERELRSLVRWTYLGFIVFVSFLAVLVACAAVLDDVLAWMLGIPDGESRQRVRQLLDPVTWLLPAAFSWFYHRRVMQQEAAVLAGHPSAGPDWARGVSRFLVYLSAFASLALAVLGLGGLVGLLLQALIAAVTTVPLGTWRPDLAFQLPPAVVGGVAWLVLWRDVLERSLREPESERASLSRRVYLYGALGSSVLVILGTAGFVLYQLISVVLGIREAATALSEAAPAFGFTLVALGVLVYHGAVLRADTRAAAARPASMAVRLILRLPPESDVDAVIRELADHVPPGATLERAN